MSNDGLSNRAESHQPGNYGTHKLSYFDQATTEQLSSPPSSSKVSGSTSQSASLGISDQTQASSSSSSQYSKPSTASISHDDTEKMSQTPHIKTAEVPVSLGDDGKQNPISYQSAIKLLVSNNVAGSIIGRAGQTISDLQTQSSGRIKLSQTGDYFPGTQDRVCLVQGQLGNVKLAVRLLLERLHMLQEQQHSQHLTWQSKSTSAPPGFDFIIRVLVPSSSCGMIIGKAGANIKHMEESSGVTSVRLSPKESSDQPQHPTASQTRSGILERIVTLTGPSKESCINCLFIVIDGMFANHEISRYANMTTSYSRHLVPGTYTPVQQGRPPRIAPTSTGDWDNAGTSYDSTFMIKRSTSQPHFSRIPVDQQRKVPARINNESFGAEGVNQIGQREPVQQHFNPSYVDSRQQPFNSEMPPTSLMPNQDRGQRSNTPGDPMYLVEESSSSHLDHPSLIQSSSSAPDLLALHFQDNLQLSNSQNMGSPLPVDYNHFAPQMPQPTRPGFTAQVLVPDTLIGSILGRGGRALNELQLHSSTRIRISQRGEYVPGTRNRIVTIRGQTAQSVSLAQYLMSQRMVLPPTAAFPPPSNVPSIAPSHVQLSPQYHHQQQFFPHHNVQPHQQQSSSRNEPIVSQDLPSSAQSSSVETQQNSQQNQVLHETFLPNETHPSLLRSRDSGYT